MPRTREDHREVGSIGGLENLSIADRAARLDHSRDPSLSEPLDAIRKREEAIGRRHRPARPIPGLLERQADRAHTAGLALADPDRR